MDLNVHQIRDTPTADSIYFWGRGTNPNMNETPSKPKALPTTALVSSKYTCSQDASDHPASNARVASSKEPPRRSSTSKVEELHHAQVMTEEGKLSTACTSVRLTWLLNGCPSLLSFTFICPLPFSHLLSLLPVSDDEQVLHTETEASPPERDCACLSRCGFITITQALVRITW